MERMIESHHFVTPNAIINLSNNHEWLNLISERLMGILIMKELGDYYTNPLMNLSLNKEKQTLWCLMWCNTKKHHALFLPKVNLNLIKTQGLACSYRKYGRKKQMKWWHSEENRQIHNKKYSIGQINDMRKEFKIDYSGFRET